MLDSESIDPGANLIAALDLRIVRRQRVQKRAVAAAEVADMDRAVSAGADLEVPPRKKFVRHADVAFAANHEPRRWNLELLPVQRTIDADQNRPRRRCSGRGRR